MRAFLTILSTVICLSTFSVARAEGGGGCSTSSWNPEVISLYGDGESLTNKIDKYDLGLPERRAYVVLVETAKNAELRFYEKAEKGTVKVTKWKGTANDLREQMNKTIFDNRGVNCVGEQVKALISKKTGLNIMKANDVPVPAPANGKAAVSHILKDNKDQFTRLTFFLLC